MTTTDVYLNLGCGSRVLSGWKNIDFVALVPGVVQYDLRNGIPMPDHSTAVVYHSHVLEHFSKEHGSSFIGECFRVLKPGGIIRVVVPDLEQLARNYLEALGQAEKRQDELADADYKWALIELIDQMVREIPGGEMLKYWMQQDLVNESTIEKRLGHEFTAWRKWYRQQPQTQKTATKERFRFKTTFKNNLLKFFRGKTTAKPFLMSESGELHKWMYDRYSITRLLEQNGFEKTMLVDAFTSRIPNWEKWSELDVESGYTRKPDSLFIEAIKPF